MYTVCTLRATTPTNTNIMHLTLHYAHTLIQAHPIHRENSLSTKSFQRSFTVPSDMKLDTIKTELKDGKLAIKMAKRDPPKTIPITSA
mmetsp:Transcript_17474/g.35269  ORF Transcript_17474/g.35269 Transcript_17474/m.35269 type:complete len:88 (-) Transcript_17474:194-457(-)